jgi:hypothetical protein
MPDAKPRFIDPPQLFRSPRYTNVVVANGLAFIAGNYVLDRANLPLLVEARRAILGDLRPASTAIVALARG